jgi:hypothetical protein
MLLPATVKINTDVIGSKERHIHNYVWTSMNIEH